MSDRRLRTTRASDIVAGDGLANLINTTAGAAAEAVYEYAGQFEQRADYEPLERLAEDVRGKAARAGAAAVRRLRGDQADMFGGELPS